MQESQSKGKTEQCKRTVRLTHQRNSPLVRNGKKKVHFTVQNDPRNHQHGNGSLDDLEKPTPTALQHTHLPFLCCSYVYGVHNVFHSIYYLFSSDSVLFKLGFHG